MNVQAKHIYQVELTNHCNLKCSYCPIPTSRRQKGYMSEEIFQKVLNHLTKIRQKLLILHNFGEPLLHPNLERFVSMAFNCGLLPGFSTNGLLLTEDRFDALVAAGLHWMCISVHNSESAEKYRDFLACARKKGVVLFARNFTDTSYLMDERTYVPLTEKHDFAGTVPTSNEKNTGRNGYKHCDFLLKSYYVVLWDGSVVACCNDERGITKLGHIDSIEIISHKPKYSLCDNCAGGLYHNDFVFKERFLSWRFLFGKHSLGRHMVANIFYLKEFLKNSKRSISDFYKSLSL
ncbi:MAG: radical SAM protein [Candidatus Brocadiaceae bacterium]|nr:radical SAM protein [Candidatus Brocadiaceae bacterium]